MEFSHKLGLSIDGFAADFDKGFFKWFDTPYIKYPRWENPYIEERLSGLHKIARFWEGLDPLIRPEDLDFPFDCWITDRVIHNDISKRWLDKHGLLKGKPVFTVPESKVPIAVERKLTDFIDDRPKNIQEMEAAGINGWIVSRYCNAYFDHSRRIDSITEIKTKIFI